jgi:hypothetical protein
MNYALAQNVVNPNTLLAYHATDLEIIEEAIVAINASIAGLSSTYVAVVGDSMTGILDLSGITGNERLTLGASTYLGYNESSLLLDGAGHDFLIGGVSKLTLGATLECKVPLAMNSQKITGLANGVDAGDAVNFGQLSNYLPLIGGTLTGTLNIITAPGTTIIDFGDSLKLYESTPKIFEFALEHSNAALYIENVDDEKLVKFNHDQTTFEKPVHFEVAAGTTALSFGNHTLKFYEETDKVFDFHFQHVGTCLEFENAGHEVIFKIQDSAMTMAKPLAMSDNFISGVKLATADDHAASKLYVDTHVSTNSVGVGDAILVTEVGVDPATDTTVGVSAYVVSTGRPQLDLVTATGSMSMLRFRNPTSTRIGSILWLEATDEFHFGTYSGTVMVMSSAGLTMSSKKITGLANGTSGSDAMRYDQITSLYGTCVLVNGTAAMTGPLSIMPSGADGLRLLLYGTGLSSNDAKLSVSSSGQVLDINAQAGINLSILGTNALSIGGLIYLSKQLHMGGQRIVSMADGTSSSDAVTKSQLDSHTHSTYLPLTGGTLSGTLTMNYNRIYLVGSGSSYYDACNKGQLDAHTHSTYLPLTGGSLTGSLSLGNNTLTGVTTQTFRNTMEDKLIFYDNANSYDDYKIGAESNTIYANVPASGYHRFRHAMVDSFVIEPSLAWFDSDLSLQSHRLRSVGNATQTSDAPNYGQVTSDISSATSGLQTAGNVISVTETNTTLNTSGTVGVHIFKYSSTNVGIDMCVGSGGYAWLDFHTGATDRTAAIIYSQPSNWIAIFNNGGYRLEVNASNIKFLLPLDGNANRLTNIGVGTAASDATRKDYVDAADNLRLSKTGGTMTGNLTMSSAHIVLGNNKIYQTGDIYSDTYGNEAMSHWYGGTSGTRYKIPSYMTFDGKQVWAVYRTGTFTGSFTMETYVTNVVAFGGSLKWGANSNWHSIPWPLDSEYSTIYRTTSGSVILHAVTGYTEYKVWLHITTT